MIFPAEQRTVEKFMAQISIHCYVSGTVQGVWFRAHTLQAAQKLDLTGWVRNLADGRVEVLACGEEAQCNLLKEWLRQGPPLAKVKEVTCTVEEWQSFEGFEIR